MKAGSKWIKSRETPSLLAKRDVSEAVGLVGLTSIVFLVSMSATAMAVPNGLSSITSKAEEIQGLFTTLAGIIVLIGGVWCGVKFVKGDPDAWNYVWKFGLGAILVFSAPQVVDWLKAA